MKARPCLPLVGHDGAPVDLRDRSAVNVAIMSQSFDFVIHLAAQSFVPRSFADPLETFEVNLLGTLNLLTALRGSLFRGRFLYVGTADIYGLVAGQDLPISETHLPRPRNPYAVSKLAAEALCYQWSQTEQFEIVLARPFNHIGPRQSEQFVVSSFAKQVADRAKRASAEPIAVGDLDVNRDFTDVRDVVRAYDLLLSGGRNGEVYNICSGKEISLRDVLRTLQELGEIEVDTISEASRFRPSEQKRVVGSFDKINHELGWSPEIPLRQTLKDTLDFWNRTV